MTVKIRELLLAAARSGIISYQPGARVLEKIDAREVFLRHFSGMGDCGCEEGSDLSFVAATYLGIPVQVFRAFLKSEMAHDHDIDEPEEAQWRRTESTSRIPSAQKLKSDGSVGPKESANNYFTCAVGPAIENPDASLNKIACLYLDIRTDIDICLNAIGTALSVVDKLLDFYNGKKNYTPFSYWDAHLSSIFGELGDTDFPWSEGTLKLLDNLKSLQDALQHGISQIQVNRFITVSNDPPTGYLAKDYVKAVTALQIVVSSNRHLFSSRDRIIGLTAALIEHGNISQSNINPIHDSLTIAEWTHDRRAAHSSCLDPQYGVDARNFVAAFTRFDYQNRYIVKLAKQTNSSLRKAWFAAFRLMEPAVRFLEGMAVMDEGERRQLWYYGADGYRMENFFGEYTQERFFLVAHTVWFCFQTLLTAKVRVWMRTSKEKWREGMELTAVSHSYWKKTLYRKWLAGTPDERASAIVHELLHHLYGDGLTEYEYQFGIADVVRDFCTSEGWGTQGATCYGGMILGDTAIPPNLKRLRCLDPRYASWNADSYVGWITVYVTVFKRAWPPAPQGLNMAHLEHPQAGWLNDPSPKSHIYRSGDEELDDWYSSTLYFANLLNIVKPWDSEGGPECDCQC